ncbi:RNA polymerase recycling motor HelD [Paenibacillus sp. FSL H8-0537]|uniref:RNA polymerase recycling motor HelD n=2 Tax=Paenibacillus sp. FSL H8-0537 TaxID=2921399 RepID=UPI0031013CD4
MMPNSELEREQLRVNRVTKWVKEQIEGLQDQAGELREDIVDIRKNFWDDVTVNFEDSAESAETHASLKQQAELLSERERTRRVAMEQLGLLKKLAQSPYFGRIDFVEDGESREAIEPIYLGVGSLLDESGATYLIYDWRAPISGLYYDYSPGPAKYETPSGQISGEMTLKRQYIIRQGEIEGMFDTGVTIGDEILQAVLGKQSDSQMKSIVATIQREQNQIIRNEQARLLLVQGAAGSGKTSAALQRVAYLLYRYRGTLNADQIVLFSPNPMFNSYVATVLPELGEQNMQQTTYQQYLEHRLVQTFDLEDPFSQLEYTLSAAHGSEYDARIEGIRYKSSLSFIGVIDRYAASLGEKGLRFRALKFRGRTLITAEAIHEHFYSQNRSHPVPNRLRMTAEWLLKELTRLGREERGKRWVEEEMELLDNETYNTVYSELLDKEGFTQNSFDDHKRESDRLAAIIVQERFKRLRSRVKRLKFLDMPEVYRQLFHEANEQEGEYPQLWAAICEGTAEKLARKELFYEDATPYLYLKELLEGFQTNTSVKHLFVDEAQDYSPFQFHYLKKIFPSCKITALGDLNQSIFAHAVVGDSFHALAGMYEEQETERVILTRSYRSTRQISEFTSSFIAGGERIIPFNRSGPWPTITAIAGEEELKQQIAQRIEALKQQGNSSIAVIGKTAEESRLAFEALSAIVPDIHLIAKETSTFEQGVVVIPSYLAKGVEFDAVILYNASSLIYGREDERKLFYTACTRAMHELHLYYMGEPTCFLDKAQLAEPLNNI